MLLVSGFFANSSNFAPYMIPFEYLSPFKYAYHILIENEFKDIQPLNCMNRLNGTCDPLKVNFSINMDLWLSFLCLALLILFYKTLAFVFIYYKSKMKA